MEDAMVCSKNHVALLTTLLWLTLASSSAKTANAQNGFAQGGQRGAPQTGQGYVQQNGGQPNGANGNVANATRQPNGAANGGQQQIPIMNAQQAIQQGIAQAPKQPFPALNATEQNYLEQVLQVWEQKTSDIEQYQCDFVRFEYADPSLPTEQYSSYATGVMKFMAPDKGMFRIDDLRTLVSKNPAEYKANPRQPFGEYWICDGSWVHILDRNEKKATRIELPPQIRGKQIYLSPLPFLFGVKADEMKRRYWIRPVIPPEGDDSVWLEAWPKRADDAGNYSRVQVVLAREDTLPRALIVFMPNWKPEQQQREIYEFKNRQDKTGFFDAVKQRIFRQEFIPTKLPSDWTVIEEPYISPEQRAQLQAQSGGQMGNPQAGAAGPRTARPPVQGAPGNVR